VLAVLWEAPRPLTAAQISTHLPTAGIGHALSQLRAAGLVTATRKGGALCCLRQSNRFQNRRSLLRRWVIRTGPAPVGH
jgi:hypothetical protein